MSATVQVLAERPLVLAASFWPVLASCQEVESNIGGKTITVIQKIL